MENLSQGETYLLGDELLDAQHQVILSYMATIRTKLLAGENNEDVQTLMDRLDTFCRLHLWDEERVMEAMRFPEIAEHKVQHALFIAHLGNFIGRCDELNVGKKIDELNFLRAWFLEHVEVADRKYAEFGKTGR